MSNHLLRILCKIFFVSKILYIEHVVKNNKEYIDKLLTFQMSTIKIEIKITYLFYFWTCFPKLRFRIYFRA